MGLPTAIGFSFQMFYDIIDIFWIGKISSQAIAGVGIFTTIFWVVEALNEIIGVSSISLISQSFGKKDFEKTNMAIEQTITFKFLVALIGSLILIVFLKPLMSLFAGTQIVFYGLEYGYLRIFFLPIMFSSFSVNTALRSIGDSKTPMLLMILSSVVNIILDPILMFDKLPIVNIRGFNMGVKGAALATIIAQSLAFLIGFYVLFSGRENIKPSFKRLFRLIFELDKKLILIGLPNGFEVFMRQLSAVVTLYFVAIYGEANITAYTIGGRIFGFVFMPLWGFLMGGSAIIGQNLGAEKISRAEKIAKISGWFSVVFTAIFLIFILIYAPSLISIFSKEENIIESGALFLRYSTLGLLFLAYAIGLSIVFPGSGYNLPYLFMSLGSRWFVQIPLMYIFAIVFRLPVIWLWLSFAFGDISEFIIAIYFYKKGGWKYKRV
ncbi:multidrug transporter MATE [Thermosipho melanesiensis]|nr:multidrug transporter MATE [Thermosipho melanesiensis]OOC37333.1 multidrug transporter MATE [Thermosipho melanesiensis]OOC38085.1 multidrug transporter MATE [Thermosipho melanesiensis]OOC41314.1 multidrug transporter MATE [Thermosipho melanesiensis]OOC43309.1 multidrug transporter MATE [Thermosipho melanesiensis]